MKTALQFILLALVSVGFATVAFAGVTGIAVSPASASSVGFILIYTSVGSMLVALADYRPRRRLKLPAAPMGQQVVPFASRCHPRDGDRKAA